MTPTHAFHAVPPADLLASYVATLRRLDWMADRADLGAGDAAYKARAWSARAEALKAEILRRMGGTGGLRALLGEVVPAAVAAAGDGRAGREPCHEGGR